MKTQQKTKQAEMEVEYIGPEEGLQKGGDRAQGSQQGGQEKAGSSKGGSGQSNVEVEYIGDDEEQGGQRGKSD
jgi:hypothetical protein